MKDLKKNRKIKKIFFTELVLIILAGVFIFLPLIKDIAKKNDEIQRMKIDQELMVSRLSKIGEARMEYGKLSNNINKLDVLLKSEEEVEFFKEVERIAEKTGNQISIKIIEEGGENNGAVKQTISVEKDKKEMLDKMSYKKYFVIEINLKGSYEGFVNFLHKLENADNYMSVISVDVQKSRELSTGELVPMANFTGQGQDTNEKEKINSFITVAVFRK